MIKKKSFLLFSLLDFLIFALLFLFYCGDELNISIRNATPLLLLPALVAYAMFHDEGKSTFVGMLIGIFMDSVSAGGSCFNTILFAIIGFLVSLTVHFLFNSNIRSILVLSLISSVIYFILRWFFLHALHDSLSDSLTYLLQFTLPSLVYTNLFIFPFYFIQKKLYSIKNTAV